MEHHDEVGYEKSDVNVKKIVAALAVCVGVIVFFMFVLDQYFNISREKMYFNQVLLPESVELKELHQKEHETLSNYKIIDKQKGTVQLPIERAMELEVTENSK